MPEHEMVKYFSAENDEQQRFFRDLVEASQDLIWQCDAHGRYTYLNPAWEQPSGIPSMKCSANHSPIFRPRNRRKRTWPSSGGS